MKLFDKKSKKGSSYWLIYTLAFGFLLMMMYIIFGQILTVYIYPTTEFLANGGSIENADKFLGFWGFIPFMLLFLVVLFLWYRSTREDEMQ